MTLSFTLKDSRGKALLEESRVTMGGGRRRSLEADRGAAETSSSSSRSGSRPGRWLSTSAAILRPPAAIARRTATPCRGSSRRARSPPLTALRLRALLGRTALHRIERGCQLETHEYPDARARAQLHAHGGPRLPADARGDSSTTRDSVGPPSVFLTLYSPTGGRATDTLSSRMFTFFWVPVVLFLLCLCKLILSCTADDPLIRKAAPLIVPTAISEMLGVRR